MVLSVCGLCAARGAAHVYVCRDPLFHLSRVRLARERTAYRCEQCQWGLGADRGLGAYFKRPVRQLRAGRQEVGVSAHKHKRAHWMLQYDTLQPHHSSVGSWVWGTITGISVESPAWVESPPPLGAAARLPTLQSQKSSDEDASSLLATPHSSRRRAMTAESGSGCGGGGGERKKPRAAPTSVMDDQEVLTGIHERARGCACSLRGGSLSLFRSSAGSGRDSGEPGTGRVARGAPGQLRLGGCRLLFLRADFFWWRHTRCR